MKVTSKTVISLLFFIILIMIVSRPCTAQTTDPIKSNTLSLELIENSDIAQLLFVYYRDIRPLIFDSNELLILSFSSGLGYGEGEKLHDQRIITLGITPGFKFSNHRFETGLQYYFINSRNDFDFAGNQKRENDSDLRLKIGYRYDDSILMFSAFFYPNFSQSDIREFIESGFSVGVRF